MLWPQNMNQNGKKITNYIQIDICSIGCEKFLGAQAHMQSVYVRSLYTVVVARCF